MFRLRHALCCALGSAGLAAANGTQVIYQIGLEFSGGANPSGPAPWLQATFEDVPGGVSLTMQSLLNASSEFVGEWSFNFDPALDPLQLNFALQSGGPAAQDIDLGVNAFQADGDGRYDILFDFAQSNGPNRFNEDDVVTYLITYPTPISASSSDFLSAPAGGHGPFHTAAHVQGIGPNGGLSGWVTTPEPTSLAMLALSALIAGRRRA